MRKLWHYLKSVLHWIYSAIGVPPLTFAAVGVGLLVGVLYFKIIFGSFGGFRQDVENDAKIPFADKDYDFVESQWSHTKIAIWLLLSVGSGVLAYYQLPRWFPDLSR